MTKKISDFKLAEFLLRAYCKMGQTTFVDLPIDFEDGVTPSYKFSGLCLSPQDKLNKTCFSIIGTYISFADIICKTPPQVTNEEKINFLSMSAAVLRDLSYSKFSTTLDVRENVMSKLNRNPFLWLIFRDVVCPAFNRPIINIPIAFGRLGTIDGAAYLEDGINNFTEPLVFCNLEIDNPYCRDAFLFFEILRPHNLNPEAVISEIFNKTEISSKIIGLAKASIIHHDGVNDFLMTLCFLAGYKDFENIILKESNNWLSKAGLWVQSQSTPFTQSNMWWHFGLIEKMLGPSRGPDWTGYFNTKPITDDLWKRCEDERKRRGLKELPYELLLRVQSEEFKQRADLTIQGLLADNRVW
jgi:hypothetical protein